LIKQKYEEIKKCKNKAVESQKSYFKYYEGYLKFIFGENNFSNFMFTKNPDDIANKKTFGWSFIEGLGISKKKLR
jgi:hypothetical protein